MICNHKLSNNLFTFFFFKANNNRNTKPIVSTQHNTPDPTKLRNLFSFSSQKVIFNVFHSYLYFFSFKFTFYFQAVPVETTNNPDEITLSDSKTTQSIMSINESKKIKIEEKITIQNLQSKLTLYCFSKVCYICAILCFHEEFFFSTHTCRMNLVFFFRFLKLGKFLQSFSFQSFSKVLPTNIFPDHGVRVIIVHANVCFCSIEKQSFSNEVE